MQRVEPGWGRSWETQKRRQRLRDRRRFMPGAPCGRSSALQPSSTSARQSSHRSLVGTHRRFGHRPGGSPVDARDIRSLDLSIGTGLVRKRSPHRPTSSRLLLPVGLLGVAAPDDLPKGTSPSGRIRNSGSTEHSRIAPRPFPRSREASCFSNTILAGCASLSRGWMNTFLTFVDRPRANGCRRPPIPWHVECVQDLGTARGIRFRGNRGGLTMYIGGGLLTLIVIIVLLIWIL